MFAQIEEEFPPVSEFDVPYDPYIVPWWIEAARSVLFFAYVVFMIWMIVECIRKDPDRWWVIIILVFQPFGALIYFFARWLPSNQVRPPKFLQNLTRGNEIKRLETAAMQIGNAHQYIELANVLSEVRQFDRAGEAYATALQKESDNLQALWGASLVDMQQANYNQAKERLEKALQLDPQYKFGDVSLAYGKVLYNLELPDAAAQHLKKHIKRWRHLEALYLLATIQSESGNPQEARQQLLEMLLDINGSPKAIARKHGIWKSRASKLLRKLPRS